MIELHRAIVDLIESGRRGALCTVVQTAGSSPQKAGSKLLLVEGEGPRGTVGGGAVEEAVLQRAQLVLQSGVSELFQAHLTRDLAMCCGGRMDVFIEPVGHRAALHVFGGGHVGAALCAVAPTAGFDVTVIDGRPGLATRARHPAALHLVEADPIDAVAELTWGAATHAVIATHDHRLDEQLLERCLPQPWAYLGMIGSKAKVARLRARLLARGADAARLDAVHAPIGLDLGGREPGEIAIAIVAELIASRRRRALPSMRWVPPA